MRSESKIGFCFSFVAFLVNDHPTIDKMDTVRTAFDDNFPTPTDQNTSVNNTESK